MVIAVAVCGVQTSLTQCVLNSFVDLVLFGLLDSNLELVLLNFLTYVISVDRL